MIFYIFLAAENNIRVKNNYSSHFCFQFQKLTFFWKKKLKHNSVLTIFFWLKNIVLYHVINCIFYLPSIEKFETLRTQKCKKCFLTTGPWNSNFDNSGQWKRNFDTWGPLKSNLAQGPQKSNLARGPQMRAGGCGPKKSNTLTWNNIFC